MRTPDEIARARATPIAELIPRGHRLRRQTRSSPEWVGPCPRCGGRDRFSINSRKNCWNCRGDRCKPPDIPGDAIGFVRWLHKISFPEAVEMLVGPEAKAAPPLKDLGKHIAALEAHRRGLEQADEREQHRKAAWLWSQRRPLPGSIAEKYLRVRGIVGSLPATLGFLPATNNYPPALIAGFGFSDEPEPGVLGLPQDVDAVHLTRLLPDGSDRERGDMAKIMLGRSLGLPITIAPPNDLFGMAVTEGIEDALSVHQATGLGAWAAGSAGRMPALAGVVPPHVDCVTVYSHPDQAGQNGARGLAEALHRRGVAVVVEGLVP